MPYPIEEKLVIAVASSALFDLSESDRVFQEQGAIAYRDYQEEHLEVPLDKGVAFPFVRRFLNINKRFPETSPVPQLGANGLPPVVAEEKLTILSGIS